MRFACRSARRNAHSTEHSRVVPASTAGMRWPAGIGCWTRISASDILRGDKRIKNNFAASFKP